MAASVVEICNIALARIGVNSFISSLEEPSAEAAACLVLYPHVRDVVLGAGAWPWALRRATVASLASTTERTGWSHAHVLPNDCLYVVQLVPRVSVPGLPVRIPWAVEYDQDLGVRVLLTNDPTPEVQFVSRVTLVSAYPPLFVDALAWGLASELCVTLAMKEDVERRARQRYELALSRALAAAYNEQQRDSEGESELITVRDY